MDKATARSLLRFFTLILAALLVGLLQGDVQLYLLLALGGYLLWYLWNLSRFEAWVKAGAREDLPDLPGIWGETASFIIYLKHRNRVRKRRYKSLIKEFRKSSVALPDGAIVLDDSNTILWFNEAAGRMLGLKKATDRGQSIVNFLRRPEFVDFMEQHQPGQRLNLPAAGQSGRYFALELVPYGRAQRLLLVRDISREVQVENMRRDFVANASHELRSPLTVLAGYLDGMADDPTLHNDWGRPLAEMQSQTRRMTGILDDLLVLSRLEMQEAVAEDAPRVDVPALLELICKDALAVPDSQIVLELELATDVHLRGSENDLRSAFNNLVENAIKYTPAGGKVLVRWETVAGGANMSVIDTGVGVEALEIPRLTERFYRVDKGRSRDQGGTGLGLAIVKHVLQRHQAELEIHSQPGKGSTFTCKFPASRVLAT